MGLLRETSFDARGDGHTAPEITPSALRFALRSVLLKGFHSNAVAEGGLVGCVEIDSVMTRNVRPLLKRVQRPNRLEFLM